MIADLAADPPGGDPLPEPFRRLADRLHRQLLRMGAVSEVARVLSLPESDERAYPLLAEMAGLFLPEPVAVLLLYEGDALVPRGVYGMDIAGAESIAERLAVQTPRPAGEWDPLVLGGARPIYAFPLHGTRSLLGYIALPLRTRDANDFDLHIFSAVARTAASALVQRRALSGSSRAATEAFTRMISAQEAPSRLLAGHSARVAETARKIAARLGLGAAQVEVMGEAGHLYDLGLSLLGLAHAPSDVTDRAVHLQRATAEAAAFLERLWGLGAVASALRYHREWFDGSGGPSGIAGESIPLSARILAVAEYYAPVVQSGAAWDPTQALRQVETLAGTAFDPWWCRPSTP